MALRCGRVAPSRAFIGRNALRATVHNRGTGCRRIVSMKADAEAVASSYANALVDLAKEKNVLDAVHTDVDGLQAILRNDKSLCEFLMNPVIALDKKIKVVDSIAKEASFNEYTQNFLKLLLDKNRMDAIVEVCEAFEAEYCKLTDTQVATLRSAVKLEQEQQFLIAKKLQELTGCKNIKLKPVIDEALIGGFIVEYGSSQIDLSVKGQLDRISNDLNGLAATL